MSEVLSFSFVVLVSFSQDATAAKGVVANFPFFYLLVLHSRSMASKYTTTYSSYIRG